MFETEGEISKNLINYDVKNLCVGFVKMLLNVSYTLQSNCFMLTEVNIFHLIYLT